MLDGLTKQLEEGKPLSREQIHDAVEELVRPEVPPELKASFLTALAHKGETEEEIAAFASELREKSVKVPLDAATRDLEILDVCGTGGDHLNTFNISSTVALVAASTGVKVAKHGNRAITSQCGSADVLEALGIRVDLSPEEAAASLRERDFAFFFAPKYHPAFANIAPARKLCAAKGQRTIFNFLGPVLNPARPSAQLIGVSIPELTDKLAKVSQLLGVRRVMVVSGSATDGKHLDELSTLGTSRISEFYQERAFNTSNLDPFDFPISRHSLADLSGGDKSANAEIIRQIIAGKEKGPRREAVLLNTAAALFVAGRASSMAEGWELAEEALDSGKTAKKLKELQN